MPANDCVVIIKHLFMFQNALKSQQGGRATSSDVINQVYAQPIREKDLTYLSCSFFIT